MINEEVIIRAAMEFAMANDWYYNIKRGCWKEDCIYRGLPGWGNSFLCGWASGLDDHQSTINRAYARFGGTPADCPLLTEFVELDCDE